MAILLIVKLLGVLLMSWHGACKYGFMLTKLATYTGGSLRGLYTAREDAKLIHESIEGCLYYPATLWHVYVKIDFEKQYENAENKKDATSFLRNVGKAAQIIEAVVSQVDGVLVEAQGSLVHILLPGHIFEPDLLEICRALDTSLDRTYKQHDKVNGWRMTADSGKTIMVENDGIHGDSSFVSLGKAANRPAKFLYAQIQGIGSEEDRMLKRRFLGVFNKTSKKWVCHDLQGGFMEDVAMVKSASFTDADFEVTVNPVDSSIRSVTQVHAKQASVESLGSPVNENPNAYFGWVMRADLDGFTKKVADCYDDDVKLMGLAQGFRSLMAKAAEFAKAHEEVLIQLPWAGDNFTAVSVYDTGKKYEAAAQDALIDLSLDFDEAMHDDTRVTGFSGWAQGIAGGGVHGNANGNIYLGAVSIPGHRFLIAAGVGVGRSLQAFVDMNPEPQQFAVLYDDYQNLLEPYKRHLKNSKRADGGESSLFRKGQKDDLGEARGQIQKMLKPANSLSKTLLKVGAVNVAAASRPFGGQEGEV